VHIVVDHARLPVNDAVVMAEGSRILFAIPWGQRTILGTTDTDYSGDPANPTCDLQDVRYILDVTNDTFPSAELTTRDVISAWAGLRPLIDNKNGGPSDISRRHLIQMTEPGWFDVAGGKLTTYRLMAEQTIDQAIKFLNIESKPCATATTPLLPNSADEFSSILPPAVSFEAVEHFCKNEWAKHLDDVMIRRTSWHQYHRDHYQIAHHVADWMGVIHNWSLERRRSELQAYRAKTNLPFTRDEATPELQVRVDEEINVGPVQKTHAG
jgi:glycerol-3-phosphate dehydrogenase